MILVTGPERARWAILDFAKTLDGDNVVVRTTFDSHATIMPMRALVVVTIAGQTSSGTEAQARRAEADGVPVFRMDYDPKPWWARLLRRWTR